MVHLFQIQYPTGIITHFICIHPMFSGNLQSVAHQERATQYLSFKGERDIVNAVQLTNTVLFPRIQSRHPDTRQLLVDKLF